MGDIFHFCNNITRNINDVVRVCSFFCMLRLFNIVSVYTLYCSI